MTLRRDHWLSAEDDISNSWEALLTVTWLGFRGHMLLASKRHGPEMSSLSSDTQDLSSVLPPQNANAVSKVNVDIEKSIFSAPQTCK